MTAAQEPDGWLQVTDWDLVGLLSAGTVADKKLLDHRRLLAASSRTGGTARNSTASVAVAEPSRTASPNGSYPRSVRCVARRGGAMCCWTSGQSAGQPGLTIPYSYARTTTWDLSLDPSFAMMGLAWVPGA